MSGQCGERDPQEIENDLEAGYITKIECQLLMVEINKY